VPPIFVSIVTPVLNGRHLLPDLLASIAAQDYQHIEHIVIDGGSTDGTQALLDATPGVVWRSEPDRGMYDAINKGFRLARGEILAYQNADDRYVAPDAISSAVAFLTEHPEVDVVYGDYRVVDVTGRELETRRSPPFDPQKLARHNYVPPHSTFVRRRVLEAGHWLDPTLDFPGDWDWFLGMALARRRFAHIPRVLSDFRQHAHSKTSTVSFLSMAREWRRVCRRHGVALTPLLWCELVYLPARRRLGRWLGPQRRSAAR
jgi:glycosyltransferase involved in cell wall biosynthesis